MATKVHLKLKLNGTDIEGECVSSDEPMRDKTIECLSYVEAVDVPSDSATGRPAGNRRYAPVLITKRVDKTSPLLNRALYNNETAEAEFRFFRSSPSGDGTTQHFFTVVIERAQISSIKRISPDVTDAATARLAPFEEVGITFGSIDWKYEDGNVEARDPFSGNS